MHSTTTGTIIRTVVNHIPCYIYVSYTSESTDERNDSHQTSTEYHNIYHSLKWSDDHYSGTYADLIKFFISLILVSFIRCTTASSPFLRNTFFLLASGKEWRHSFMFCSPLLLLSYVISQSLTNRFYHLDWPCVNVNNIISNTHLGQFSH